MVRCVRFPFPNDFSWMRGFFNGFHFAYRCQVLGSQRRTRRLDNGWCLQHSLLVQHVDARNRLDHPNQLWLLGPQMPLTATTNHTCLVITFFLDPIQLLLRYCHLVPHGHVKLLMNCVLRFLLLYGVNWATIWLTFNDFFVFIKVEDRFLLLSWFLFNFYSFWWNHVREVRSRLNGSFLLRFRINLLKGVFLGNVSVLKELELRLLHLLTFCECLVVIYTHTMLLGMVVLITWRHVVALVHLIDQVEQAFRYKLWLQPYHILLQTHHF